MNNPQKTLVLSVLTALIGISAVVAAGQDLPPGSIEPRTRVTTLDGKIQGAESPLAMDIRSVADERYSSENIPLEIVFTNNAKETVRLLDAFDTLNKGRTFFIVTLVDSRESPVFTSGGGKMSFMKDSMKYVELAKGDQLTVTINLRDFDLHSKPPEPGIYSVLVTYQNQYGDNCFRGTLKAELHGLVLVY